MENLLSVDLLTTDYFTKYDEVQKEQAQLQL